VAVYALANQKGGVGKTTTAVNLAACLAEAGEPTLLIDLDPQANATSGLGEHANGHSSFDLLDGARATELAASTRFANLELIPARTDLAGAAADLAHRGNAERYLAESLNGVAGRYRFVFLDCPPSLGPLTVNALAMVDGRTKLAADVAAELERHFGPLLFKTRVPRSVRIAEAPSHGLPVIAYDRRSAGADAYWKAAMELVERS
jgi:chromosome partitioning protein